MTRERASGKAKRGPLASPGYHVWSAGLAWARAVSRELAPLDLTHTQFFVLGAVRWLTQESGAPPNQRAVSSFATLDPMTTTQVVRALEQRGLLVRTDDPNDSRAWVLALTKKGEHAFTDAIALVRAVDTAFFGARGPALVRELARMRPP